MHTNISFLIIIGSFLFSSGCQHDKHIYHKAEAIDHDGDGFTEDEDCNDLDPEQHFWDHDGDGFSTCDGDCDDQDPLILPIDQDGDGYFACGGDCDDQNPNLYPDAIETWFDDIDQDCNGRDTKRDGMRPIYYARHCR